MKFAVNLSSCIKDPSTSDLGKKMISSSIDIIDRIGLEQFTFKKLAESIDSAESSVYRYFESKHKLLVYLSNWYWSWLQHRIIQETSSFTSPFFKLEKSIELLASPIFQDDNYEFVDTQKLYKIIIAEGPKVYLIKDVATENNLGAYLAYKSLCEQLSRFILEINPKYKHSHTLASTIVETCHNQIFFSEHLPRLTDVSENDYEDLKEFLINLTAATLH
ncbi:MAG: TetR/AcrR family transcriptional regulator [Bacteroidia bacterium]